MSSNYEWQNFQAGERVQARLREAKAHRQARPGDERRRNDRPALALPFSLAFFIAIALVVWLLAGCTSATAPLSAAPAPVIFWAEIVGSADNSPAQRHGTEHRRSQASVPNLSPIPVGQVSNLTAGCPPQPRYTTPVSLR